jgi:uncharacterized protein (DUF924 family)
MSPAIATPEEVLSFWFVSTPRDEQELMEQGRRWMAGGEAMDAEVRQRFGSTVEAALTGELDGWASTARGRLALIVVLDQFTRNYFRGDPRTYSGDAHAQALALAAVDGKEHEQLEPHERLFVFMPLLHAEDMTLQRRGLEYARSMLSLTGHWRFMAEMHVEQTEKYNDIIRRFGRFPHRNELLGRESTADERLFLEDWIQRAPPSESRARQRAAASLSGASS